MNRKTAWFFICSLGLLFFIGTNVGHAINVDGLKMRIDSNEKITLIDIRLSVIYKQSHIHNAINIPLSVIDRKQLPPLGNVIVYGDGIDEQAALDAVEKLNRKAGIYAEMLEGGFAAWQACQSIDYSKQGLDVNKIHQLTYQKLCQLVDGDPMLTLVDLRTTDTKTPLDTQFENQRVINAAISSESSDEAMEQAIATILSELTQKNQQLLVLIGDNNLVSDRVAMQLQTVGITRLAVLPGGEEALQAKGEVTTVNSSDGGKQ